MGSIEKFEITYLSIFSIIDKIDIGEIALPDIQRPFIWDTTKVRDLVDSLYNDYLLVLLFYGNCINHNPLNK